MTFGTGSEAVVLNSADKDDFYFACFDSNGDLAWVRSGGAPMSADGTFVIDNAHRVIVHTDGDGVLALAGTYVGHLHIGGDPASPGTHDLVCLVGLAGLGGGGVDGLIARPNSGLVTKC